MHLVLPRATFCLLGWVVLCGGTPAPTDWDKEIRRLGLERPEIQLGYEVVIEGKGVVKSRAPGVPRAAASAIKTAIAIDFLGAQGMNLDEVLQGSETLLEPGTHPAMSGFTPDELAHCRTELAGKTYRDLLSIMMGRRASSNEAYNAACNLIMIKLGGPESITRRLHGLDPSLRGIVLNRYMQQWNGDGDNQATPDALVSLYRMTASGAVPGLGSGEIKELRELLRRKDETDTLYEKEGTLFPRPMVRVRAGFVQKPDGCLVYAIMGEVPQPGAPASSDLFLQLMRGVDAMAVQCRRLYPNR
jgi:hypothetical protein